jgi:hypothetical protein
MLPLHTVQSQVPTNVRDGYQLTELWFTSGEEPFDMPYVSIGDQVTYPLEFTKGKLGVLEAADEEGVVV